MFQILRQLLLPGWNINKSAIQKTKNDILNNESDVIRACTRDCYLYVRKETRINDIRVTPDLDDSYHDGVLTVAMDYRIVLFLFGFIVKKADKATAIIAVAEGVLVIVWITFSLKLPEFLQSPFHTDMSVVVSTLTMFLVGLVVSQFRNKSAKQNSIS